MLAAADVPWWLAVVAAAGLVGLRELIRRGPAPDPNPVTGLTAAAPRLALLGFLLFAAARPWGLDSWRTEEPAAFYLALAATRLAAGVAGILLARRLFANALPLAPPSGRSVAWSVLVYLAVVPVAILVRRLFDDDPDELQSSAVDLIQASDPLLIGALFVVLVIATPLFEEVVFRGLFQGALSSALSPTGAIIGASVLFALIHGKAAFVAAAFVLGLLLGVVCARGRSLWLSILIHALHNGVVFAYFRMTRS